MLYPSPCCTVRCALCTRDAVVVDPLRTVSSPRRTVRIGARGLWVVGLCNTPTDPPRSPLPAALHARRDETRTRGTQPASCNAPLLPCPIHPPPPGMTRSARGPVSGVIGFGGAGERTVGVESGRATSTEQPRAKSMRDGVEGQRRVGGVTWGVGFQFKGERRAVGYVQSIWSRSGRGRAQSIRQRKSGDHVPPFALVTEEGGGGLWLSCGRLSREEMRCCHFTPRCCHE